MSEKSFEEMSWRERRKAFTLPDNLKIGTPVEVTSDGHEWFKRYYAGTKRGMILTFPLGTTEWSSDGMSPTMWSYGRMPR